MTRCSNVSGHRLPGNPSVSCTYPAIKNFADCDIPLMPIKRLITVSSRDESRRALLHGSRLEGGHHEISPRDGIFETRVAQLRVDEGFSIASSTRVRSARTKERNWLITHRRYEVDGNASKRREASPFPTRVAAIERRYDYLRQ